MDGNTPTKDASTTSKPNPTDASTQDQGSSDDDEDAPPDAANGTSTGAAKKKKKKKSKKKKKATPSTQSDPPRVPLTTLFPTGDYPVNQEVPYVSDNAYRTTSEELKDIERRRYIEFLSEYRLAAETHRQVRQAAQRSIKPGQTLTEIAENIEEGVRALTGHAGLEEGDAKKGGMGFPCGLSINECAAHFTPNKGDTTVLREGDVMKVDFGAHINGRIVDSAFTLAFQDHYTPLLDAAKAATNAGVAAAGIDVRVSDIGAVVQEVMESYEVTLPDPSGANSSEHLKWNGQTIGSTTFPVKSIRNLNGHDIVQFSIHGGKSIPIIANTGDQTKMEEGEIFAIETFGSTGRGYVSDRGEVSHFARDPDAHPTLRLDLAKKLLKCIDKNFGTLPWCPRYLDRIDPKVGRGLGSLVNAGVVRKYPPLCDVKGSYTAQFEHTFVLRPTCKEVVSRGDDY